MYVFETQTETGREQTTFRALGENILSIVNVGVRRQVKSENSSLPVTVHVSKTRVLKLPRS